MVFNRDLLLALRSFPRDEINKIRIMHDNWIYKVNMSIGGYMAIDSNSYILYRQHESNSIGALQKNGLLKRHIRSIKENKNYRSESLRVLFHAYGRYMPDDKFKTYDSFTNYKKGLKRFSIAFDPGY